MVSLRAWRGLLTFAQVVSASPFDGAPTSTGLPDRESRLTGVGESEGLYLVGWKTERGEHTFNGLGLALQVQAV